MSSRTSARAAGRPRGVPRVAADAVQHRFGDGRRTELGRVRLADDHESGLADPAHDGCIADGNVVGERAARVGGADPARVGEVLDRDRDAAKRPVGKLIAPRGDGLVVTRRDERVQLGLDGFEAAERFFDQFGGRHLAMAHRCRKPDSVTHELDGAPGDLPDGALGADVPRVR